MAEDLPLDRAIATVAARQHGNITRRQLLDLGVGSDAITYRVRSGRLHRVHIGVYAVGRPPITGLEKAAAAALACGPGAALSHASAMALWGFWKRWGRPIEVVVPGDRRPAGIRVHRPTTLHRRDLRSQHGIRVTSPARTLLDVAPRLSDKQRTRAVNNALHSTYLKLSQLEDLLVRVPTHPAAALLKPFIDHQSAPTRSTLEDDFMQFCERFDLPTPQTNVLIGGYLVDAYFPSHRLIVELDSWSFHSTRTDFEIDRNRDADHLTDGIPTIRITHQRITNKPDAEAARLHKILASRE